MAVVAAMEAPSSHAHVQDLRCGALRNLACNDDNKLKIAAEGDIKTVLTAIETHSSHHAGEVLQPRSEVEQLEVEEVEGTSQALVESPRAGLAPSENDSRTLAIMDNAPEPLEEGAGAREDRRHSFDCSGGPWTAIATSDDGQ